MTALATADSTANAPVPFAFGSHQIRTVINGDGTPWFVAKDAAVALGLTWTGHTLDAIPKDWVGVVKLATPKNETPAGGGRAYGGDKGAETPHPKGRGGWRPNTKITVINEPAVYKLAFRSNKPEADRFTNWVASEVIPALRRQGKYEVCPTTGTITPSQQQEIKELVQAKASAYPDAVKRKVFSQIWMRLQRKFKVPRYEELPVALFGEARDYVIAMQIRSVAEPALEGEETKALPPARRRNTLDDYKNMYRELPDSPQHWLRLITETFTATEALGNKLDAIKAEATKPFRSGRTSDVSSYFDASMSPIYDLFSIADEQLRLTYRCVYNALEGCRNTWLLLNKG